MGTSALKSTAITNLDTSPPTPNTAGKGAPGYLKSVSGYVTAVAADAAGSTYRLVRLPSNAVVKQVQFESEAQGAGKVQLGVYYSDASGDGTPQANVSRWNAGKDLSFVLLRPDRVVEVGYDHMEGDRFRHTAQFKRWRDDRDPESCGYEQLDEPVSYDLADVLGARD